MYAEVLSSPPRAFNSTGNAYAGAKWYFYASGTTTAQPAYTTPGLATAHANPVIADASGIFPPIFFDATLAYRGVCRNAADTVTLHDIDPVNPALLAAIGAGTGSSLVGFAQTGTGAALRTVLDKLRNDPVDVEDFGAIGTADDTAVFAAAYGAAKLAGRPLRLPSGSFAVSGLLFDGTVPVYGNGTVQTGFRPTANNQTVITVLDRGPDGDTDRGPKNYIADFSIDLGLFTGCTALFTNKLIRTTMERIFIIGGEYATYTSGNVGWRSVGDQYSSFRDIYIEFLPRGFVMTSDVIAGGGLNNHFDGLHVAYCQVNMMMVNPSIYPMGLNHFTNIRLQNSFHCSLYMNGAQGNYFSMLPPEGDSAAAATLVVDGYTIKRGTIHADNFAMARFDGYDHVTNDPNMKITAENHSALQFHASRGAKVTTDADSTSTITWEGIFGNGSTFRNTRVNLQTMDSQRSVSAWHPADCTVAQGFPNDCAAPMAVPVPNTFGCTSTLCADADMGVAREVTYLAAAGALSVNSIWCRVAATEFAASNMMYGSILLRSDRDTQIGFVFAQSSVSGIIDLKAGQWTRLYAANYNTSGTTRYAIFTFYPIGTDAPVLRIARPLGARNLTAQQARMLSERHMFNPKDQQGCQLRLSAPPTTGAWTAGAQVLHSAPVAGGTPGWVCTASGTPGTWKAMAVLAA